MTVRPPRSVRLLDVVGAGVGLLVTLPVWPLIMVAIKLDSSGPVFFRGTRLGEDETTFGMLKFRSMRGDSPIGGAAITVAGDDRITRVGRILRLSKLDELPQLINVLRGEMSLVGPRPEAPRYLEAYPDELRDVLRYRPGITSPASLAYRHEEQLLAEASTDWETVYVHDVLPRKAALDLDYCRGRTARSDLRILLRTGRSVAQVRSRSAAPS